ncbi:MAG: NAD(+) synthase [Actinomyces sp.]|nr:NAD(+) synthase [Actinomyces sp.]MCI1641665.1 NAD(+) synthase [Actinomyces sp.]MCI1661862.1 NAD(+) synthase [Actinomyces sp.]MCI1690704.1 NAD(+) synthase [Actinomyces sp.]MCI1786694.1 NAD(+) synthase [Actinomyces sp.]MCI1829162.1 NAD(+) synthase [Actinomyces sp.]
MEFRSIYDQGFARVAAVTIPSHPAQPARNAEEILLAAHECSERGVAVAVFPELCVSGYAIDDLLLQDVLLDGVEAALDRIREASRDLLSLLVVGAPLRVGSRLYNCAVAIHRGRVVAVVPKQHLPTYREFYEKRYFAVPAPSTATRIERPWLGADEAGRPFSARFGATVIDVEDVPGLAVGIDICEDMWVPVPPSSLAALAGATVIVNLSASPITVGRAEDRRLLVRSASARTNTAYVYCAAGQGESTTDLSWDGQTMVYEMGDLLAEGERFPDGARLTVADVDLDRLRQERLRQGSFDDNAQTFGAPGSWPPVPRLGIRLDPPRGDIGLERAVDRFPFVPDDPERLSQDCYEAYNIQVSGLEKRLRAIGAPKAVIGVSGGLDSTHALIVAAKAMDRLGRPRSDILAYTLPGFATSERTRTNATLLCERLGVSFEEIDITPAARQMLADLRHPWAEGADDYDVTFENVQAGLRTDYLFRLANHHGGIVIGTGDLSELALGWCTYGVGDQMSHYAVNTGVPKTMIQHLIRWVVASGQFSGEVGEVLLSILDTEITPELIPTKPGEAPQSTEASIGPYNLQDFTLYYLLRRGYRPSKIAFLAERAWADAEAGSWPAGFPADKRVAYSLEEIVRWERLFLRRFFANQFKRTAIPNGPKVMAGGSLSPRGDWRMPADASAEEWLAELEEILGNGTGPAAPRAKGRWS